MMAIRAMEVELMKDPDIAEIYSPPRVIAMGKKLGLRIGEPMDLTTGWDFRKPEHREQALKYF